MKVTASCKDGHIGYRHLIARAWHRPDAEATCERCGEIVTPPAPREGSE